MFRYTEQEWYLGMVFGEIGQLIFQNGLETLEILPIFINFHVWQNEER